MRAVEEGWSNTEWLYNIGDLETHASSIVYAGSEGAGPWDVEDIEIRRGKRKGRKAKGRDEVLVVGWRRAVEK